MWFCIEIRRCRSTAPHMWSGCKPEKEKSFTSYSSYDIVQRKRDIIIQWIYDQWGKKQTMQLRDWSDGLVQDCSISKCSKWRYQSCVNSLRRSDAIWRHRSGSTLAQVMACCLTAPSHYLNQCWLIISKVFWHSSEGNFLRDTSATIH